eukprot:749726-Hanusia_phi.AAC.1
MALPMGRELSSGRCVGRSTMVFGMGLEAEAEEGMRRMMGRQHDDDDDDDDEEEMVVVVVGEKGSEPHP